MTTSHNQSLDDKSKIIVQMKSPLPDKDKLIDIQNRLNNELITELRDHVNRTCFEIGVFKQQRNNRTVWISAKDLLYLFPVLYFHLLILNYPLLSYSTELERRLSPTRFELWCLILNKDVCQDMNRFVSRFVNIESVSRAIVKTYDILSW